MPRRTCPATAARSSMALISSRACPAKIVSATIRLRRKGTRGMQSWIHVIEWRANVRPDVLALVDDRGAAYTYAQLRAAVERKAGGWAGLGVGPGDVVAIVAKNSADFLVHAFALMRAGVTPAFVNWRLSPRELTKAGVTPARMRANACTRKSA